MKDDCCPDESALFSLLDEPDRTSSVAEHAGRCPACTAKKEELAMLIDDLREPVRSRRVETFVPRLTGEIDKG